MSAPLFIPTAEAAFIAGLTDRQMNRVVDERLVPETLFAQRGSSRLFTRLGAAFAKFYFATEDMLIAGARRQVLEELAARVERLPAKKKESTSRLAQLHTVSWKVERQFVAVDVLPFIQDVSNRAREVDQADALVTVDNDVMGGTPVFAGTRVPIDIVLGSLAASIDTRDVKEAYPFLTAAHIQAAKVYEEVHPRRGRPRRIAEVHPELPRRVTRVVKRAAA